MTVPVLVPTRQRDHCKRIYGFDVETYDDNKKFYCATLYDYQRPEDSGQFFKESEVLGFITDNASRFRNTDVIATNLHFDFFATMKGDDQKYFKTLFRGSNLIYARSNLGKNGFSAVRRGGGKSLITFLDTLNYAPLSVASWGEVLGLPKLDKPKAIGRLPKGHMERKELLEYNYRDAEISAKAYAFLIEGFRTLGASPKITIASTAMSLFKNKYLKRSYVRHQVPHLLDEFKAYYGGRVEAFSRGPVKNVNYYDFNSLYPAMMLKEFPDPDTMHMNRRNTIRYLDAYDGVTKAEVFVPDTDYPLLPFRYDNKLLFPTGSFTGWYTNAELRRLIDLGGTVKRTIKNYYCIDNCYPFVDYVNDVYDKRLEYLKEDNPMQLVTKLLLNSLYGKFGQKFVNKDNWVPVNTMSFEELDKYDKVERVGEWFRVVKSLSQPATFTIPLWANHVTAYGRMQLHDYIKKAMPYYVDTDSFMTTKDFETSKKIGKLKLEMRVKKGMIVKPKMYMLDDVVKVKGIGKRLLCKDFERLLLERKISYPRFVKFKESLRRGLTVNEIVEITKHLDLEDNKRVWPEKFSPETLQHSKPINNPLGTGSTTKHPIALLVETTIK